MLLGEVSVVLAGERIAELHRGTERAPLAGAAGRRGSSRASARDTAGGGAVAIGVLEPRPRRSPRVRHLR